MTLSTSSPPSVAAAPSSGGREQSETLQVFKNRKFLSLWTAQLLTQVGGNMVLYGLTILVYGLSGSNTSVSILILTFLVPAVIFSAIAGVYVDRFDRRFILVVTNLLRGVAFVALFFLDRNLTLIFTLTVVVATLTTFFAPAEAAMIPRLVDRGQLLAANGIFVFTLQASFALGFAVLGPLVVTLAGVQVLLLFVAALYVAAGALCLTLPRVPRATGEPLEPGAESPSSATFSQLKEGLSYIREHRNVFWPLTYLAITASLIGVLGVLGPDFATKALGLGSKDFVVVVLPLGVGLVVGILVLNVYGRYLSRRRVIEGGLLGLSISLAVLSLAGPISNIRQLHALGPLASLLAIVVLLAIVLGVAYAFVAVPAQTQLQEELPEEVRGRVFGVLNMLVNIASFLPIVVVGPISDLINAQTDLPGTPTVIFSSAVIVIVTAIGSIMRAHPPEASAAPPPHIELVDPVTASVAAGLTERDAEGTAANRARGASRDE